MLKLVLVLSVFLFSQSAILNLCSYEKWDLKLHFLIDAIFITFFSVVMYLDTETARTLVNYSLFITILVFIITIIKFAVSGDGELETKHYLLSSVPTVIAIVFWVVVLIGNLSNGVKLYDYSEEETVKEEFNVVYEENNNILLSKNYAKYLLNKATNLIPNNEFYEVKDVQIQTINGKISYVGEIGFKGFFKWNNKKTIPGYLILDASSNKGEVKFVEYEYEYSASAYLSKNANRIFRNEKPNAKFIGEDAIEIGEDGKVYFTKTIGDPILTSKGFDLKGILLMDAKDGSVKHYAKGKIPEWIDGGISPEYALEVANYFASYKNGTFNPSGSGKKTLNKNGTFNDMKPVLINNDLHWFIEYSTYSSTGNESNSMNGYMIMNSTTGKFSNIIVSGSNMDSTGAVSQAEKEFKEKAWKGKQPTLMIYKDQLVWVVMLNDSDGLFQKYFVVSSKTPSIYASDVNIEKALSKFETSFNAGSGTSINGEQTNVEIEFIIAETLIDKDADSNFIYYLSTDGKSYYFESELPDPYMFKKQGDVIKALINTVDINGFNQIVEFIK